MTIQGEWGLLKHGVLIDYTRGVGIVETRSFDRIHTERHTHRRTQSCTHACTHEGRVAVALLTKADLVGYTVQLRL